LPENADGVVSHREQALATGVNMVFRLCFGFGLRTF
jgi:hypothetical protein